VLARLRAVLHAATLRSSRVHGALHDAQRLSDRLFGRKSEHEQKQMKAIVRAARGLASAAPARPRVLLVLQPE
jgi:hypothetical protein